MPKSSTARLEHPKTCQALFQLFLQGRAVTLIIGKPPVQALSKLPYPAFGSNDGDHTREIVEIDPSNSPQSPRRNLDAVLEKPFVQTLSKPPKTLFSGEYPPSVSFGSSHINESAEIAGSDDRLSQSEKMVSGPSVWWTVHFPDLPPLQVVVRPPASSAEMEVCYPQATLIEPSKDSWVQAPVGPMTPDQERAIKGWLSLIGETDSLKIANVLNQCQSDQQARHWFLEKAGPRFKVAGDLRHCHSCRNLSNRGPCLAAQRGEIVGASRTWRPIDDLPRLCICYLPKPNE